MPKRRPKVLIVDGDKEVCLALYRALFDGNALYDVLVATSASTARDIMRDVGFDVLVTDVDSPAAGGIDLVCWAALEFPEAVYVVQTKDLMAELQDRMGNLGCLRLMKKPCPAQDVLKIVRESLDCVHRLSGCFSTLSAADLIQMLCLTQRSVALRIAAHGVSGTVMVNGGQLVHAKWGPLSGPDALCEILDAADGVFRTTPLPDEIEHNIHVNWQHALMEAVRELDERVDSRRRQSGSFPSIRIDDPLSDRFPAAESREAERETATAGTADARKSTRPGGVASSLVDKGFAALRAGKVEEARQCWLAAKQLDPDNRSLDLNLKKLDSRASR